MLFRSPHPEVAIPDVSLSEFVLRRAYEFGARPALLDASTGRSISFREVRDRVRSVAAGLSRRVSKGDVVAIWAPNVPEYAVVFHAVVTLGAIVTTISVSYTTAEVAFQLRDANASLLVTTTAMVDRARAAIAATALPIAIISLDDGPGVPSLASIVVNADPPAVTIDPATDVAAMPYSSGTTGLPKGVMLTHRNLVANLAQLDAIEEHFPALVAVLPFFHIYGMTVLMNLGLVRGATVLTLPRFELESFLGLLQDWRIPIAHVVPPMAIALARHPVVDRYDLSSLRWVFSAAAPLGEPIIDALEQRLGVGVRQGYGMTEASPATHFGVPTHTRRGTVGSLVPNTECRIVDPETGTDAAAGKPGEVWARGPQVMKGYLNNLAATAATVDAEGWLHTGDIGLVDEDGFLVITDRLKELIKVKGCQVAPAELEALLLTHPQISDAAVIGIPDDTAGERPKAFVVTNAPLSEEDVLAFVDRRVAHYKRLAAVTFVDAIPKSPSGKILRRILAGNCQPS
jgi:acyl-CoA synthetase (AMP-forming)/AMP-acid ligase II